MSKQLPPHITCQCLSLLDSDVVASLHTICKPEVLRCAFMGVASLGRACLGCAFTGVAFLGRACLGCAFMGIAFLGRAYLRRASASNFAALDCRYYSALPTSNADYYLERPDQTTPTNLAALVGQAYQAQPGSSEDKALYQVGKAQCHVVKPNDVWSSPIPPGTSPMPILPSLTVCATG